MAKTSEYWNPKNETLSREDLRALQHLKLKRLCEWAYAKSDFHRQRWDAAAFHPDQLRSLDDLQRIPFMTRAEWMEAQAVAPPFGSLLTTSQDQRRPLSHHLRHHRQDAAACSRRDEGLGVDLRDVGVRALGLRACVRPTSSCSRSPTGRSSVSGARTTPARRSAASCSRPGAPPPSHGSRASSTWASPRSARRRPTRCGCGNAPPRWASTSPATARSRS